MFFFHFGLTKKGFGITLSPRSPSWPIVSDKNVFSKHKFVRMVYNPSLKNTEPLNNMIESSVGQGGPVLLAKAEIYRIQGEMELSEPQLSKQLNGFLSRRTGILKEYAVNGQYDELGDDFVHRMYMDVILERNQRAKDFTTEEMGEVYDILAEIFELPPYGAACIDSRVMRTIICGLPLRFGGFSRIPAGDLPEFVPGKGGQFVLRQGSFSDQLSSAFAKDDKISQILDSHLECAARGGLEARKGKNPKDGGLYEDVSKKKRIAEAMMAYVSAELQGKSVIPIQTSFNPESGFLYMGLETDSAIEAAKKEGFTENVLGKLEGRGEIIHTEAFLDEEVIGAKFRENEIPNFSWEDNYRDSTVQFWKNVKKMIDEGLRDHVIEKYVKRVYPDASEVECKQRAVLLLGNAFNAFLLTEGGKKHFPYSEHKESCIVISEGENGPYGKNPSFSVYSGLGDDLAESVILAEGIVRENRQKERIDDYTKIYKTKEDYLQAPVPILLKAIVREDVDWKRVSEVDWSDMPENWTEMNDHQFKRYVMGKYKSIPLPVFDAINFLRNKMIRLYKDNEASEQLFGGNIAVVPMLVDADRRLWSIVPFISSGYSPQTSYQAA